MTEVGPAYEALNPPPPDPAAPPPAETFRPPALVDRGFPVGAAADTGRVAERNIRVRTAEQMKREGLMPSAAESSSSSSTTMR